MSTSNDEDAGITPVIFRMWRAQPRTCIALFPYDPGTNDPGTFSSYMHEGQHGATNPGIIERTRPAAPDEYAPLKRELESAPYRYRFRVIKRMPHDASTVRAAALRKTRPS